MFPKYVLHVTREEEKYKAATGIEGLIQAVVLEIEIAEIFWRVPRAMDAK